MLVESLSEVEPAVRLGSFTAAFIAIVVWEVMAPRRRRKYGRSVRWPHNLALFAVDVVLVRLVAPGVALGVAAIAQLQGWGLLNTITLPPWAAVVLAVVALDFAIYLQHVVFHAVPLLWRLHRVHHADPDFDVTTGSRFHPVEILLSLGIKCSLIAVLGAPPLAVLIFEVVLNVTAMFNHANGRVPAAVDRWLRWLVVTPDMHRVHHSAVPREMNRNFGFNLPWWDRLFGTYLEQPAGGHSIMRIGVEGLDAPEELKLTRLLTQPLRAPAFPIPFKRSTRNAKTHARSCSTTGRSRCPGSRKAGLPGTR